MTWRRVLLLYVAVGVLAAEYWLVERPRVRDPEARPSRPRFLTVEPAALREVRLRRDGRTVVTRREGSVWTVVEPPGVAIPPDLISAFANALTGAEEIARFAEASGDASAYGLESGARVEMVSEAGEPVVVTLGDTNPTGTALYARRAGTREVVLIGRNVRYYEDLIFQALAASRPPETHQDAPVGG